MTIGNEVLYNCESLNSIVIPNAVTMIGDTVFRNCASLHSIVIPNVITMIGDDIISIVANSVTKIGNIAFYNGTPLASMMITVPLWHHDDFQRNVLQLNIAHFYCDSGISHDYWQSSVRKLDIPHFYRDSRLSHDDRQWSVLLPLNIQELQIVTANFGRNFMEMLIHPVRESKDMKWLHLYETSFGDADVG